MLKNLRKQFWEFCPKYNGKIVKSVFYLSKIFLWGNFFPEKTTHMFVLLRLRTKRFRTFIERFSTFFKTAVYVSTDKFCGKKFFFFSNGLWAKFFCLFSIKVREGFRNCILLVQRKSLRSFFLFWKTKVFLFFLVFFQEIYRKTSWNWILSVQRIIFRGKTVA